MFDQPPPYIDDLMLEDSMRMPYDSDDLSENKLVRQAPFFPPLQMIYGKAVEAAPIVYGKAKDVVGYVAPIVLQKAKEVAIKVAPIVGYAAQVALETSIDVGLFMMQMGVQVCENQLRKLNVFLDKKRHERRRRMSGGDEDNLYMIYWLNVVTNDFPVEVIEAMLFMHVDATSDLSLTSYAMEPLRGKRRASPTQQNVARLLRLQSGRQTVAQPSLMRYTPMQTAYGGRRTRRHRKRRARSTRRYRK